MRTFSSGATRDSDESKIDLDGFLSPLVIKRFGEYMNKHRVQADGGLRASDNWQLGIEPDAYIKSGWRHWFDVWALHRGHPTLSGSDDIEEELCALLFNVQGYLHERLKSRHAFDDLVEEVHLQECYKPSKPVNEIRLEDVCLPADHPFLHATLGREHGE